MGIKRTPPPPSTHRPYRISVRLSDGKTLRVSRTPRGDIQIRMAFNGVTFPGPEFCEDDLSIVREALERMALKIQGESE